MVPLYVEKKYIFPTMISFGFSGTFCSYPFKRCIIVLNYIYLQLKIVCFWFLTHVPKKMGRLFALNTNFQKKVLDCSIPMAKNKCTFSGEVN